jgi:hypothetical protein
VRVGARGAAHVAGVVAVVVATAPPPATRLNAREVSLLHVILPHHIPYIWVSVRECALDVILLYLRRGPKHQEALLGFGPLSDCDVQM